MAGISGLLGQGLTGWGLLGYNAGATPITPTTAATITVRTFSQTDILLSDDPLTAIIVTTTTQTSIGVEQT